MMNTRPILEAKNLSAGYTGQTLFNKLQLTLCSGELICFMGPNGAGKSTLIRTLAGIQSALGGTLWMHGKEMSASQLRTIVSLVLTDPVKAPYMTVYDLVTYGRYPHTDWRLRLTNQDHAIIESAIRRVNIWDISHRKLNELSDGQRQMAMIARALAQETSILLMDEPTAHLDLNNRVEIMKLLKVITRETGKVVLMATHELDLALQTADQIWLATRNQSILTGIPEDLVLRGAFDEVFQFKGFDLRTGRVQHQPFRSTKVSLHGTGYYYLWTRNLLERNGFIVEDDGDVVISIDQSSEPVTWKLASEHFFSVDNLLKYLLR